MTSSATTAIHASAAKDCAVDRDSRVPEPKELRAVDCKTPEDWKRRARERVEYEDPYGYRRGERW